MVGTETALHERTIAYNLLGHSLVSMQVDASYVLRNDRLRHERLER